MVTVWRISVSMTNLVSNFVGHILSIACGPVVVDIDRVCVTFGKVWAVALDPDILRDSLRIGEVN